MFFQSTSIESQGPKAFIPLGELEASIQEAVQLNDLGLAQSLSDGWAHMYELADTWNFIVADGKPVGVELGTSGDIFVAIMPDENGYRLQHFDAAGLCGHKTYKSAYEALEKALLDGYTDPQPGMMEYLSHQPSWIKGTKARELRDNYEQGLLTVDQLNKELQRLAA